MTGEPWKLPEGWRWAELGQIVRIILGSTPSKTGYASEPTGYKMLKFRDVMLDGTIDWSNDKKGYVASPARWRAVEGGDVLVTGSAHSPEQIGRKVAHVDMLPADFRQVFFSGELIALRPDAGSVDGRWLAYWLRSAQGYAHIQKQVKEKHLVKSRATLILVPLPPLPEQQRIVALLEQLRLKLDELDQLHRAVGVTASMLRSSVLDRAFLGQL